MDQIKAAIAKNITQLRTDAGMTQLELAEKLNYSDKAVSKWERAEALPDVVVLVRIGEIFGVTINDLISETPTRRKKKLRLPVKNIMALSVATIWLAATILFVIGWLADVILWEVFVFSVPVSMVTLLVLHSIWEKGRYNFLIVAGLIVGTIASLYCIFLRYNQHNWWQLFLLLVPAMLVVWLSFRIKRRM